MNLDTKRLYFPVLHHDRDRRVHYHAERAKGVNMVG